MAYSINPSIGMMPMKDISNVLEGEGFIKDLKNKDIEAVTTGKGTLGGIETIVTPGIKDATRIAICVNKPAGQALDRETVKNALNLNGKSANEFLSTEDKKFLEGKDSEISDIYSREIQLLRDELYGMKNQLTKTGFLEDTDVAKGFLDSFKSTKVKNTEEDNKIIAINSNGVSLDKDILKSGDWVVVKKTEADINSIALDKVSSKTGNSIVLENGVSGVTVADSVVKSGIGEYKNGTFSFSTTVEGAAGTKERYTSLNDDVTLKESNITANNTGFATVIRIPSRHSGFLTKFIIQGRKIGNPGLLMCYVLEGDYQKMINLSDNNQITKLIDSENYVAKSNPIYSYDKNSREITFDFSNLNLNTDSKYEYPEIKGGTEYCFIIEAFNVSADDKWVIEFGTNRDADLQTNNKSFTFSRKIVDRNLKELEVMSDYKDMFYAAITKEKVDDAEIPYKFGLYTTAKPIKISTPMIATRTRLVMEINKEGKFVSTTKGLIKKSYDSISFKHADGNLPEQLIINLGDKVVVGDTIATVTAATSNSISIDKTIYISDPVSIYRVGYDVQVRLRSVVKDPVTFANTIEAGSERIYHLALKSVISNGRTLDNAISDRLVFEYSTNNIIQKFNEADLQIKWGSNLSSEIIRIQALKDNDYVGRIRSLNLSFDTKI